MRDRPIYISLLLFGILIYSSWRLIHAFPNVHSTAVQARFATINLPNQLLVAQYFLNYGVPILCCSFMLNGANWARVLYIAYGIISFLLLALFDPVKHNLQPDLDIFAVAGALLLLPGPRGYFLLPDHFT